LERDRTLLSGFLTAFALTLVPLPDFWFWPGMTGFLDAVVHDLAFVLALAFAVPLLWRAVRRLSGA